MNKQLFMPKLCNTRTVIVANGQYPSKDEIHTMIKQARNVVCCDGAISELLAQGITPSAIVGDCDSLSADLKLSYASIIHVDNDQQTNDLTKAVNYCIRHEQTALTIVGATGKREDHTIANISLLAFYAFCLTVKLDVVMISDYGVFTAIDSDSEFDSFTGQKVSIFGVDEITSVTFENLRYPLINEPLHWWWQGTLNESMGDKFVVKTNGKAIIFRAFAVPM